MPVVSLRRSRVAMPLLEDNSVSFIVRIWCEPQAQEQGTREWRGSIEHVHSGRRGFFRDIRAITEFMRPHLDELGIDEPIRFWDAMTADLFDLPSAAAVPAPAPGLPARRRRASRRG